MSRQCSYGVSILPHYDGTNLCWTPISDYIMRMQGTLLQQSIKFLEKVTGTIPSILRSLSSCLAVSFRGMIRPLLVSHNIYLYELLLSIRYRFYELYLFQAYIFFTGRVSFLVYPYMGLYTILSCLVFSFLIRLSYSSVNRSFPRNYFLR